MLLLLLEGCALFRGDPHRQSWQEGRHERRYEVFRENLRRFAAGEMLLNVVDKKVGY